MEGVTLPHFGVYSCHDPRDIPSVIVRSVSLAEIERDDRQLSASLSADETEGRLDCASLVRRYSSAVMAICLASTRKLHDAEDLMQEVFVKAFTRLHTLRKPENARPWLLQIARRTCTDYHRRSASPVPLPDGQIQAPKDERDPRIARLHEALNCLPDRYREAVILFYLDGRSCPHVASCLGISESAARQRVARGRLKLRDLLGEDDL